MDGLAHRRERRSGLMPRRAMALLGFGLAADRLVPWLSPLRLLWGWRIAVSAARRRRGRA